MVWNVKGGRNMKLNGKILYFAGLSALVLVPAAARAQYEPDKEPVREPAEQPPPTTTTPGQTTTQPDPATPTGQPDMTPSPSEEPGTVIVPQPDPTMVPQPQPIVIEPPAVQPVLTPPPAPLPEEPRRGPLGIASIHVGGGVANFTRDEIRDLTDVGGYWDARVVLGTRSIIGVEASYVGAAQNIEALGLDSDATLIRNGVEGALRLNLPFNPRGSVLVEPYAFGGAGWSRYNLVNEDFNTSNVRDEDDVFTVPLGVGLSTGARGFLFDARFTYRPTFGDDLVQNPDGSTADLQNWTAGASIGYEF